MKKSPKNRPKPKDVLKTAIANNNINELLWGKEITDKISLKQRLKSLELITINNIDNDKNIDLDDSIEYFDEKSEWNPLLTARILKTNAAELAEHLALREQLKSERNAALQTPPVISAPVTTTESPMKKLRKVKKKQKFDFENIPTDESTEPGAKKKKYRKVKKQPKVSVEDMNALPDISKPISVPVSTVAQNAEPPLTPNSKLMSIKLTSANAAQIANAEQQKYDSINNYYRFINIMRRAKMHIPFSASYVKSLPDTHKKRQKSLPKHKSSVVDTPDLFELMSYAAGHVKELIRSEENNPHNTYNTDPNNDPHNDPHNTHSTHNTHNNQHNHTYTETYDNDIHYDNIEWLGTVPAPRPKTPHEISLSQSHFHPHLHGSESLHDSQQSPLGSSRRSQTFVPFAHHGLSDLQQAEHGNVHLSLNTSLDMIDTLMDR